MAVQAGPGDPPAIVLAGRANARFAYDEFFAGEVNDNTQKAYRQAVHRFLEHCENLGVRLEQISPGDVSSYIKGLQAHVKTKRGELPRFRPASPPTKKLHLAGIRKFFDKLVECHAIVLNPARSIRGPKHSVTEGKTPAITSDTARDVLRSIDTTTLVGLRDRAIIGTLIYTAARAGAVAKLRLRDFYTDGRQWIFRFDEKGGKVRDIPARHDLEEFVRNYIDTAGIDDTAADAPLFRTAKGKKHELTTNGMNPKDVLRMVKRRFKKAGLPPNLTCHTFRATTITDLLDQGINPDDVQHLAGHADPRTTRLYDRRKREVTRNIVERISI